MRVKPTLLTLAVILLVTVFSLAASHHKLTVSAANSGSLSLFSNQTPLGGKRLDQTNTALASHEQITLVMPNTCLSTWASVVTMLIFFNADLICRLGENPGHSIFTITALSAHSPSM